MHFAKQNALAYCRRRNVKLPDGLPIGEKGQMKDEFEVRLRDQPNELFRREKNNQLKIYFQPRSLDSGLLLQLLHLLLQARISLPEGDRRQAKSSKVS